MERWRKVTWAIAGVSALALGASASLMGLRVAAYHKEHRQDIYAFQPIGVKSYSFAGKPVLLEDIDEDGEWKLRVRYGDSELKLKIAIPGDRRLPELLPHEDWLRVFRFASATGHSLDELRAKMDRGEVKDRLAIVTRTPEPGADPQTWGEINRKAWKFDFYEFNPDGGFTHERKSFPATPRPRLKTNFANLFKKGEPVFSVTKRPQNPDELEEGSWQFSAALLVMPAGRGPNPQFTSDGLEAMGWTLPATSSSILALMASMAIAASPRRVR